jgi:integrase
MSYVVQRATGFGAYYRDPEGRRKSAGVYATRKEAQAAAVLAESGVLPEVTPGVLTLDEHYRQWISRSDPDVMPNTIRAYEQAFEAHILKSLGDTPVSKITRRQVETVIADMRTSGCTEHQVANVKAALGSCLRVLVPDVLNYNPTHGIKIRRPPAEDYELLEHAEIERIIEVMPTEGAKLFTFFLSATGCRHGEAAEIRVKDIKVRTQEITVLRRVTDLIKTKAGRRFQVVAGTKAGINRGRTVGASPELLAALLDWVKHRELGENDLVFPDRLVNPRHRSIRGTEVVRPGEYFIVDRRRFQHGTAYAYSAGGCRCRDCREALRAYRSTLKGSQPQEVEHLSSNTWGVIWRAALRKADLGWKPRSYDLRHYYATTLVSQGVSLPEVSRLMGHQSIQTTMRYQRRVDAQTSQARSVMSSVTPGPFALAPIEGH